LKRSLVLAALIAAVAVPGAASSPTAETPRVLAIHFVQEVNPVTQGWLNAQLDRAHKDHYDAAVILLDTPGGLEDSMRKIVRRSWP
jgi:membrane-bound ClpP family serine protease